MIKNDLRAFPENLYKNVAFFSLPTQEFHMSFQVHVTP